MAARMTKDKILARLQSEHDRLLETIAQIPDEDMLAPHFEGGWSAKDLLAHITLWEHHTLDRIQATLRDQPLPEFFRGSTDNINVQGYDANRERSLDEVWADFHRTYQELIEQVAAMTEEDLADPRRFPWTRRVPVRRSLSVDGYSHYAEHTRQIQAWLDSRTPTP